MIFKYPYTDLYNLNLDWVIQAIKEVQQTITDLGTVVNTFNGRSGDVTLDAAGIASIVGGIVNSFNGRSGAVELTEADVNATLIDIVWTSDPGEVIGDLTQTALNELFAAGRRVLIFNNALGEPDRIYFLTLVNDVPTPQQYIPTGAIAGVASVNGQTGAVTVRGDTIPVSGTDPTTVEDALAAKEDVLTFDSTPTSGSSNPVTSAGIEAADGAIRTSLATLSGTVSGINNRLEAAEQAITDLGPYNGLDSDSTTAALAAAQGKALSQQIVNLGGAIAYNETGDNASRSYTAGQYIIWKNSLYTVNSSGIGSGEAITGKVTAVTDGGLNAINNNFGVVAFVPTFNSAITDLSIRGTDCYYNKTSKTVHLDIVILSRSALIPVTGNTICTVPTEYAPTSERDLGLATVCQSNGTWEPYIESVTIRTDGTIALGNFIYGDKATTLFALQAEYQI